jgi:hypothetical protein
MLIVGVILATWGVIASDSIGSDISRVFTGSFPDKVLWLVLGGGALAIFGLMGALRSPRAS